MHAAGTSSTHGPFASNDLDLLQLVSDRYRKRYASPFIFQLSVLVNQQAFLGADSQHTADALP